MGRPKATGRVYYLGRVRYVPGLHAEALGQFLARFAAAGQDEKLVMLEQLLAGNSLVNNNGTPADAETEEILEDLLSEL